jgi:predicted transcriptional regulator
MSLTITLSDELTQRLEDQARRLDVPVAEWVMKILAKASDRPDENTTWEKLNARRFELIEKGFDGGLASLEAEGLVRLQESVDRVLEPWDQQMLDQLAPIEEVAWQIESDG